ncbi:ATP-binding cassette domain-containing protein, partial [Clostridium perfringens]
PDNQLVATIVEVDVGFGPENLCVDPKEIRERVYDSLKAVGMYEYRKHAPHLLSGGQKQRIAIAGILEMRPQCIVLDEPTAMLDPSGRNEVMKTI